MQIQEQNTGKEGWQPRRDELDMWLKRQVICTFSTLDADGAPEGATVAFSVTKQGEYIVGTDKSSHKAVNVAHDGRVALTVTDDNDRYTAQIKGTAKWLSDDEFAPFESEHYLQRIESVPFKMSPNQVHILITPQHIKFSDCSVHPWLVTEY